GHGGRRALVGDLGLAGARVGLALGRVVGAGDALAGGGDLRRREAHVEVVELIHDVVEDGGDVGIAQVAHGRHHGVVFVAVDGDLAAQAGQHRLQGRLRVAGDPVGVLQWREGAGQALAVGLVAGGTVGQVGRFACLFFALGRSFVDQVVRGRGAAGGGADERAQGEGEGDAEEVPVHGVPRWL